MKLLKDFFYIRSRYILLQIYIIVVKPHGDNTYNTYAFTGLQKFVTPICQTLEAVGGIFRVGIACVLHPFFKQFIVLFQQQILAQYCVCLEKEF